MEKKENVFNEVKMFTHRELSLFCSGISFKNALNKTRSAATAKISLKSVVNFQTKYLGK